MEELSEEAVVADGEVVSALLEVVEESDEVEELSEEAVEASGEVRSVLLEAVEESDEVEELPEEAVEAGGEVTSASEEVVGVVSGELESVLSVVDSSEGVVSNVGRTSWLLGSGVPLVVGEVASRDKVAVLELSLDVVIWSEEEGEVAESDDGLEGCCDVEEALSDDSGPPG